MSTLLHRLRLPEISEKLTPFEGDPERTLAAKALYSVLLGALRFGVLYLAVIVPFFVARKAAASAFWAVIIVITLACMYFVRRGRVKMSSWIFLSTTWLMLAIFVVLSGGITSPALLSHMAVIVVSVWLLDRRAAIWIAAVSLAFSLSLAILESIGVHLPRYFPAPPIVAWVIVLALVCLTILPLASVSQALADSARQAQRELEARRTEEQVRAESDKRFRATFFQAAVGIAQTGLDGQWLLLNDRFCEILGYSPTELSGKTFVDITHPDDREASLTAVRQLLSGEISSWSKEKRYLRKDGATVWGRLFTSLMRDQHNQPQYFISVVEDITEKIQAECALRDAEQRLALAQDAAHLGVWDADQQTGVVTICGEYAQLHGLPPDRTTITREEWSSLIHPDDRERVQAFRLEAREQTHTFDAEFRVLWPEGSVHWLRAKGTVLVDGSGHPVRTMGVVEDITQRKQTEAALRESEERFGNMADSAPVMIWVSGLDKLCTFFNKPWLDFTGRTMEQELGNGWASGVYPGDLARCLATYSSSFDARSAFQMEYRLRRADGGYRWVLENGIPYYRDGAFVGFIGSCVDITDQRLMADRLRDQTVQFKDAQRLAKVGSWERDVETGTIGWSDEMLRIFGQNDPLPTLPGFLNCVHPKDREKVSEAAAEVHSRIAPVEVSYRIIRPDGEMRFVRAIVEAIRDDQGIAVRTVGSTQDITEQVKAERLLRESEERLKNAERLAHVGNWQWEFKSNQISWSEEMFRIFGQPPDYIPSYDGIREFLLPEDRQRMDRAVTTSVAEKSDFSCELQIARPNGDLCTITCLGEVLLDEEGLPQRMVGATQDITELRRSQHEDFAKQKLESVGTLASGIAHDFNNLLGGVLAQAELALSELAAGVNPEEQLWAIRDVAIRGSEIVRELMIYAGKGTAVVGLVNVSRLVKEMIELLMVSVSKHALLETDLGQDLPAVRANAAQLRQVVMNLVTNASDAIGDRDGVIRVTTRRVKGGLDSPGEISGRLADGDYLELEVSDTGRGIPLETQSKVFDPFFTTKSAGHGLGLAIVHGIVRGLGGAIHLTSEPGKGTTFQILLPCAETPTAENSDATPGVEVLPSPSQDASILVVEDEGPLRQAVTKMLRQTGFEVLEAADGTSAIDLLRVNKDKIDMILLDMTIPGASSAEVVAEAAKAQPPIKVILTSAYSQEMVTPAMSEFKIRGFIRKPFRLGDLVQALRNALSS